MSGGMAPLPPERAKQCVGLAIFVSAVFSPAMADSNDVHGRIELQDAGTFARSESIDSALGAEDRNDLLSNLRLTWEPTWGRWSVSLHYLLTLQNGDGVRLQRAETGLIPSPPASWFDLSGTFINHAQTIGTQAIDRLSIAYTAPDFVIRIGRQALSWGSGFVFRPMDLFDPFAPNATDTEYKPGTDMIYTQWLFADGSDAQFIVVPRSAQAGGQLSTNASSIALHLHMSMFGHQTTWLLARDHGDWVGAFGVNGALGEATWNLELEPTFLRVGPVRVSALANISDAMTLFNRNATVFAEYFHNGFGVASGANYDLASLPPDLIGRLARGQLFNSRRDYLAGGLTLEVDPLLNLSPSVIVNLNDDSAYGLVSGSYSLSDSLNLIAGIQIPIGPLSTEFGGFPLAPRSGEFLAPPEQLYLQLRQYF